MFLCFYFSPTNIQKTINAQAFLVNFFRASGAEKNTVFKWPAGTIKNRIDVRVNCPIYF